MKIFKTFIIYFLFFVFILSNDCFATDINMTSKDLYIDENSYTFNNFVSGNVFSMIDDDFVVTSNSSIAGDLFVVANDIIIESSITYSDTISKDGNPSIKSIDSAALIYGNVFALCNNFTIESGVEIHGDLYVTASNINIASNVVVSGNIFVVRKKPFCKCKSYW